MQDPVGSSYSRLTRISRDRDGRTRYTMVLAALSKLRGHLREPKIEVSKVPRLDPCADREEGRRLDTGIHTTSLQLRRLY